MYKENKAKTDLFNNTHKVDLAGVGAGPDGSDLCIEIKVPSPLTATHNGGGGAHPPDVGDRYGFGNTEEHYRIIVLGCKPRGTALEPLFDSTTGKGRVVAVVGDYYDALAIKRNRVIVYLVESTGGIAPEPLARIRRNARLAKTKNARDSTKYGEARVSPRSYYTHHTQRISAAAVRADAQNARVQIACLKQSVCAAA
jgi:hypothetical protein